MKAKLLVLMMFAASQAMATTQNVTVSGVVSSTCSFGSVNNGTFGYDVQTPNLLDTVSTGGANAIVSVFYNGTPTVSIVEVTSFSVVPNGFTDTVNFTNIFTSSNIGSISYSSGSASFTQVGGSSDTLTLRLRASNASGPFPIGNYSAATTITCI